MFEPLNSLRISVTSFLLILLTLMGCHPEEIHNVEIPSFSVAKPKFADAIITQEYVGQIRAIQHIEIRALERGYLESIHIDEGQAVKQGELLFQILPRLYKAELQKAEAETSLAEIEFKNTKQLADSKVVSNSELSMAAARLEKVKSALAIAQAELEFTKFRAPFDGIVGRFFARQGSLLEEGELLTTISDNHQMWVYFNLSESEYLAYKNNVNSRHSVEVKLRMANGQLFNREGKVTAIEADFNNETGNIAFRATFDNPEGLLRHGQTGNILVPTLLKDALQIPQSATFEILDRRYVFVVMPDNKVRMKEIKVIAELPDLFVIDKGLTKNSKILLEGLRKVKDGQEIEPRVLKSSEVYTNLKVHAE